MPRTKAPATPGAAPAPDTSDIGQDAGAAALAQDALAAGALAAAATSEAEDAKAAISVTHAELAKRDAEIAELKAMVKALGRNQIATAMPEKVKLPELGEVMKDKPAVPVLTAGGWYVPPVHPTDRTKA